MRDILFGNFIEEDMNSVFWNLKCLHNGIRHFLNELFLLLRGSPWKQTDLNGWHLFLLSSNFGIRIADFGFYKEFIFNFSSF